MTGSSTNITIITIIFAVSIALFGFVLAFLISSILTKDQVAADKRLDELKKNEGDSENYALVKHESRIKAKKRLEPGKLLLVDTKKGKLISDDVLENGDKVNRASKSRYENAT